MILLQKIRLLYLPIIISLACVCILFIGCGQPFTPEHDPDPTVHLMTPTNVTATFIPIQGRYGRVSLLWDYDTDNDSLGGFTIYREDNSGKLFVGNVSVTGFSDTFLQPDHTYKYAILATPKKIDDTRVALPSDTSNPASVYTLPFDWPLPSKPHVTGWSNFEECYLQWNQGFTDTIATGYHYERRSEGQTIWGEVRVSVDASIDSVTLVCGDPGVTRYYRMYSFIDGLQIRSEYSDTVTIVVPQ